MKNQKMTALIAASLLLFAQPSFAQSAAKPVDSSLNQTMFWVFLSIAAVVFIAAMLTIVRINKIMYRELRQLLAEKQGISMENPMSDTLESELAEREPTSIERFFNRFWSDATPIAEEAKITGHHEFDGIRELDNNLPPWWVAMFYLTIIWAIGYMIYFQWGGPGLSQKEEYEVAIEKAKIEKSRLLSSAADKVNEETVALLTDKSSLEDGQFIFKQVCAACHGQNGEGNVGPNFTDDYWLHGGGIKNVFKTIKYGVPDKGMISWESQIKPSNIQKVASYILSLHGTNPPNPKAPQGEIWKETPTDSTKTVQAKIH